MVTTQREHQRSASGRARHPSYAQRQNTIPPYKVHVHNDGLWRDLVLTNERPSSPSAVSTASKPTAVSVQSRANIGTHQKETKRKRRREHYETRLALQQQKQERLLQHHLNEAQAYREKEFSRLRGEVEAGQLFERNMSRILHIADSAERSKSLKQYEDWKLNVYGVIQGQIDAQLEGLSTSGINDMRRKHFDKFLTSTNAKTALFRDIIIESEYDPLEPNRNVIKAQVGRLLDPCSRVLDKHTEENTLLFAEEKASDTPSSRETLDVQLWDKVRIKDTPHGYFAKIMNKGKQSERLRSSEITSNTYKSSFKLDDYNVERGRDIVTKEFPRGKRTYAAGDEFAPTSSESKNIIGTG